MAAASTSLPSSIANDSSGLPQRQAGGARNRASTPAPQVKKVTAGTGASSTGTSDGKVGEQPRGVPDRVQNLNEKILRAGFLRKVYGLLAAQLVLTVTMASVCMLTPLIRNAFLNLAQSLRGWFQLAIFIPSGLSLLVLNFGVKDTYPANYVFLFLFTAGMSIQVSYVCSVYYVLGYGHLVLQACGMTAIIFLGLSTYVLYSGKDFSYLRGFLMTSLWGLIIWGFGAWLFPWMRGGLLYGFGGALVFCGYILYDTWRIQKQFSYDDYIGAVIELYLDIINLFLYILDILTKLNKADNGSKDKKK